MSQVQEPAPPGYPAGQNVTTRDSNARHESRLLSPLPPSLWPWCFPLQQYHHLLWQALDVVGRLLTRPRESDAEATLGWSYFDKIRIIKLSPRTVPTGPPPAHGRSSRVGVVRVWREPGALLDRNRARRDAPRHLDRWMVEPRSLKTRTFWPLAMPQPDCVRCSSTCRRDRPTSAAGIAVDRMGPRFGAAQHQR